MRRVLARSCALLAPLAWLALACDTTSEPNPSPPALVGGSASGTPSVGGAASIAAAGNAAAEPGNAAGAPTGATGGTSSQGPLLPVAGMGMGGASRGTPFVYVGSGFYDVAQPALHVFRLDEATGALDEVQSLAVEAYPSFMAVGPGGRHLYVNVENSPGSAIAYSIDPSSGKLIRLNDLPNGGNGSAYISTDSAGRFVLQVNYESGSVVVLSTQSDGSLGRLVDSRDLGGKDAYPHSVLLDPTDHFAFVTNRWDPGAPGNYIAQFKFDATTGVLTPNQPAKVELPFGTGPRHLAFHPSLKLVYVNNERNSTVSAYSFDAVSGTLTKQQDISTLPAGMSGGNAPADMRIHPSGNCLYVANRGQYSLAVFAIDSVSGSLKAVGHETFEGQPRNLFIDPKGGFLVAGDLGGDKVRVYRVDEQSCQLSPFGSPAAVDSPAGLAVVYVPIPD